MWRPSHVHFKRKMDLFRIGRRGPCEEEGKGTEDSFLPVSRGRRTGGYEKEGASVRGNRVSK